VLARAFGLLEGSQMAALAVGAAMAPLAVETLGVPAAFVIAGLLGPAAYALTWPWLRRSGDVRPPPARVFELVDGVAAFARMPLASRDRVARALVPIAVGVGGSIVREGEHGDRFFIVDTGEVEISIAGTYVRTLRAGASFGELALLHDIPRTATARASSDVRLYALDRAEFVAATSAAGALARRL
jgi:CRP-like cAMP-binding protein